MEVRRDLVSATAIDFYSTRTMTGCLSPKARLPQTRRLVQADFGSDARALFLTLAQPPFVSALAEGAYEIGLSVSACMLLTTKGQSFFE